MRDITTEIKDKYQECCTAEYTSVGTAMTAVKQLQILYNDYLREVLIQRRLPTEIEKKVLHVIEQYSFPLEPTIKPNIEPSRIIQETIGNFTSIRINNKPKISFSLTPGKSPDEVIPLLDKFLESVISACSPKYLKTGSSLLKIIRSIVYRIDYTKPMNSTQAEINRTLEGLLRNFDVEILNDVKIGEEYGNYDFFEMYPNKNIKEQFITSPAVISREKDRIEILIKGSLVYPEIDNSHHD